MTSRAPRIYGGDDFEPADQLRRVAIVCSHANQAGDHGGPIRVARYVAYPSDLYVTALDEDSRPFARGRTAGVSWKCTRCPNEKQLTLENALEWIFDALTAGRREVELGDLL